MKKITFCFRSFIILLVLILACVSFSSCLMLPLDSLLEETESGGGGTGGSGGGGTGGSGGGGAGGSGGGVLDRAPDETFESTVLVDNEICTVKVTGIDSDNLWGYALKINIENKSPDTTYTFAVHNAAINGVECDPYFSEDVAAGKKANAELSFSDSKLEKHNIGTYTDIELELEIYDSSSILNERIVEEIFHVYPYGEEYASLYTRETLDTDTVLVDNQNISIVVTGYKNDPIWGYVVEAFVVNKTNTEVMVSVSDASVNGYMIDPFFASSVSPKKSAFMEISWSKSGLSENEITTVEELEFLLKAYDYNNILSGETFFLQTVTLNP